MTTWRYLVRRWGCGLLVFAGIAGATRAGESDGGLPDTLAGRWLTNAVAEAFVSPAPYPRVAAFRLTGSRSPFRESTNDHFYGMRTWFMEPGDGKGSSLPALQPAELVSLGARAVRLRAAPEATTRLQVVMEITLDEHRSVLTVRHGLKNLAPDARRLAVWSIMAFPHEGAAFIPAARQGWMARAFLFFPNVSFSEPCLRVEDRGMWVDFHVPVKGKFVKVGTNTDAGWAAYFTKGLALKSSVPWEAGQEYPEGGGTATLFNLGSRRDQGFCEVEHMGPLRPVAPGETAWLEQRIELIAGQGHRGRARERWVREWLDEK